MFGVAEAGAPEAAVELAGRSMISGGGARRQPRPIKNTATKKTTIVIVGRSQFVLTNRRKHLSQNRLLVQMNQRKRTILFPHSQQKFGR